VVIADLTDAIFKSSNKVTPGFLFDLKSAFAVRSPQLIPTL
jgi:hypothetical protein